MIITLSVLVYLVLMGLVVAFLVGAGRGARASDPFAGQVQPEPRRPRAEPVKTARDTVMSGRIGGRELVLAAD